MIDDIFPDKLCLRFKSRTEAIKNLVVQVYITVFHKNNIPIGTYKTDSHGTFLLNLDEVIRSIASASEEFPMDYDISETNLKSLKFIIESESDLKERIDRLAPIYANEAKKLKRLMENSSNGCFHTKSVTCKFPINVDVYDVNI